VGSNPQTYLSKNFWNIYLQKTTVQKIVNRFSLQFLKYLKSSCSCIAIKQFMHWKTRALLFCEQIKAVESALNVFLRQSIFVAHSSVGCIIFIAEVLITFFCSFLNLFWFWKKNLENFFFLLFLSFLILQ